MENELPKDFLKINIKNLIVSENNVRAFNEINSDITFCSLIDNIKTNGILNPLLVILSNKENTYEIIAGQRRYYALVELNKKYPESILFKDVPCRIIDNKDKNEQIVLSLTENIHRLNMNLSDRVKAFKVLYNFYKNNSDDSENILLEVSKKTNYSKPTISKFLKISHLPDSVLNKLDTKGDEKISLDFAIQLSKIGINEESELLEIVNYFNDISSKEKLKLLKKITDSIKYNECKDFEEYLKKFIKKGDEIKPKSVPKPIEPCILNKEVENNLEKELSDLIENKPSEISVVQRNPLIQSTFRKLIINRFKLCIISEIEEEFCEAAHIIPYSECIETEKNLCFNPNNGILLNCLFHKFFDKYLISINPKTLKLEISNKVYNNPFLKLYRDKKINILENFPQSIDLLKKHYNIFKSKNS